MIIAEAGINHNGNISLAKDLVDAAIYAGADAVKFQTFWNLGRLEKYELNNRDWTELINYCNNKHIMFLSTPHCYSAIDILDEHVSVHKLASPYINNPMFIKLIASKNKPTLISTGSIRHDTGMANDEEIEICLSHVGSQYLNNVTLMHCVSKYPCHDGRYDRIDELKSYGLPVGLSDHTKNIELPKGLVVYEKHLMLDGYECVDKDVSITPDKFKKMVQWLKST